MAFIKGTMKSRFKCQKTKQNVSERKISCNLRVRKYLW